MRIIVHVDMDYFFAQAEERENPALKGWPVIVGADPKNGHGRGVVTTCNYEARRFGVKSAMPISVAWRKCPQATFLRGRHALYASASRAIMAILQTFGTRFQQVSIDEAYIDVSERVNSFEEAERLAQAIKQEVLGQEGLSCSVGVGPNKLIAKLAANEHKPDGLTVVRPDEAASFLLPKPVGALYGVGPRTNETLARLGIHSVSDVLRQGREVLVDELGSFGESLFWMANGVDDREVHEDGEVKSIGRQRTFMKDTKDKRLIMGMFDELIRRVYRDVCAEDVMFRTVTIKVRFEDFETRTKSKTLPRHMDCVRVLRQVVQELFPPFLADKRKIRLVGITVHALEERKALKQPTVLAFV